MVNIVGEAMKEVVAYGVGNQVRVRLLHEASAPIDPVFISFGRTIHGVNNGPPFRNPTRPPIRERILSTYRKQGRPQAHLDRVMRLGRV